VPRPSLDHLPRREREVMDLVYRHGEASALEIRQSMADPPSYSAVRALLSTMVDKGLLHHRRESRRYLYRPAVPEQRAKRKALQQLLGTFFGGRPEDLVASLLDPREQQLSDEEIRRIRQLIEDSDS